MTAHRVDLGDQRYAQCGICFSQGDGGTQARASGTYDYNVS
jgi:hypothetical protein